VGGVNTIWGFISYPLFFSLLAPLNLHYLLVLIGNYVFNMTIAYWLQKRFVFKTKGNILREYTKFLTLQGFAFGVNVFVLPITVELLKLQPIIGQTIFAVSVALISFFWNDKITFASATRKKLSNDTRRTVIAITGASSGIGQGLAKQYASKSVTLLLTGHTNALGLEQTVRYCEHLGAQVHGSLVDVTDKDAMAEWAQNALDEHGSIDIVFANAGIGGRDFPDVIQDSTTARKNMDTNYFGVLNTVLPFISSMRKAKMGQIVVVSSISSLRATHNSGTYSASKAAVSLWSESLRLRLREDGISVTNLIVGFVDTPMNAGLKFSMPGLMAVESASRKIQKLVSAKRKVATLPWQSGYIFWLFRLTPTPLYTLIIDWAQKRTH